MPVQWFRIPYWYIDDNDLPSVYLKNKKTVIILLLGLATVLFSCDKKCDRVCEEDCLFLDEESCECIPDLECRCTNGLKDGDEEFIDCGGGCEACTCDGEGCLLLTDGSTKTWKLVSRWDVLRNRSVDLSSECLAGATITLQVDHTSIHFCPTQDPHIYTWELDDADSPAQIRFYYAEEGFPFFAFGDHTILKLSSDTLQMTYSQYIDILMPVED